MTAGEQGTEGKKNERTKRRAFEMMSVGCRLVVVVVVITCDELLFERLDFAHRAPKVVVVNLNNAQNTNRRRITSPKSAIQASENKSL